MQFPEDATFHDFLGAYIKLALGDDWWTTQATKSDEESHQLVGWQRKVHQFQVRHSSGKGIQSAPTKGVIGHYYRLAFDLHTIHHQGLLQERLIKRLKIADQFQGARYEVAVCAAFVRAGFDVAFEAEGKGPDKLCEFVATHRSSRASYAVEAKSRHLAGVLGRPHNLRATQKEEPNIRRLVLKALQKVAPQPKVICIDVNYPQPQGSTPEKTWGPVVRKQVDKLAANGHGPAILFFTNSPQHYLADDDLSCGDAAMVIGLSDENFRPQDKQSVERNFPGLIRTASAFAAPVPSQWE